MQSRAVIDLQEADVSGPYVSNGAAARVADRTRIVLTPIAAPSILGLFGFAGATFIVAANLAGWYGTNGSGAYLFPFALTFGGVAQFVAGLWAYKARDALATAMHGMWGSFWIAFGFLQLLFATGTLVNPGGNFPELGFWFLVLGAITASGTLAAAAKSGALTVVLGLLSAGSFVAFAAYISGSNVTLKTAGVLFVASAIAAFYTASAMMLEASWGRVVLPLGGWARSSNIPGSIVSQPVEYHMGDPGARVGQ